MNKFKAVFARDVYIGETSMACFLQLEHSGYGDWDPAPSSSLIIVYYWIIRLFVKLQYSAIWTMILCDH